MAPPSNSAEGTKDEKLLSVLKRVFPLKTLPASWRTFRDSVNRVSRRAWSFAKRWFINLANVAGILALGALAVVVPVAVACVLFSLMHSELQAFVGSFVGLGAGKVVEKLWHTLEALTGEGISSFVDGFSLSKPWRSVCALVFILLTLLWGRSAFSWEFWSFRRTPSWKIRMRLINPKRFFRVFWHGFLYNARNVLVWGAIVALPVAWSIGTDKIQKDPFSYFLTVLNIALIVEIVVSFLQFCRRWCAVPNKLPKDDGFSILPKAQSVATYFSNQAKKVRKDNNLLTGRGATRLCGVCGQRGVGKSTFLRQIEAKLETDECIIAIYYDAWKWQTTGNAPEWTLLTQIFTNPRVRNVAWFKKPLLLNLVSLVTTLRVTFGNTNAQIQIDSTTSAIRRIELALLAAGYRRLFKFLEKCGISVLLLIDEVDRCDRLYFQGVLALWQRYLKENNTFVLVSYVHCFLETQIVDPFMKWKEFQDDEKKDDEKSIQARREKDYLWRRNELKKEYDRFLPDLRDALVVDYAEADGDREDFVVAVRNRFSEVTWFLSPTSASERQRQFCEKILRDFLADLGVSLAKSNYDSIYYLFIDYRAYRGIPRSFVHAIKSAIPLFVDSCEENEITKKNPEELNSPSDYEYVLRIAFGCFAYLEKNEHDQLTLSILDDKRYSNWLADYLNAVAPSASQSTIPYLIFNNDKSKLQGISREWTDVFNTMVRIYLRSKKYAQGSVVVSKDGSGVTSATASPAPVSAGSNAGSGQNIKVLFDKAIKLRENREIPNAKIEFQNCISATPATVEEQKIKAQAYIELGLLLEQEKDYTEARGKYDACFNEFQSYSQEIELLILCARALNENGNSFVREAKNNTDDAKKNDFHSQAVVEFMKCIDFVKNSKQSDTRLLVEQARALNNKGDATTTLDDKIKAFGECAKFVGDANDPALRFEKMQAFIKAGTALYDEGKVKKGVEAYNELIKNKIDNIFAPTRDVDLEFRPIPAGEFDMGSPENEDGRDTEEQQHKVIITKPFLLGKTPVTQGQWKAVMSGNPSLFKKVGDNAPVERVSWDDAVEFCKRLTEQERAAGRLPEGYAYALPTEAQWEYACRAGGSGAYGRMEDGKEGDLDKMGWYPYNSNGTTHPVAQKKPNAWGLYDMHGNVWEWCADWYADDYYARSPAADPSGPDSGSVRVSRGGSRSSIAPHCRSAFRGESAPSNRDNHYGFRLALRPVLGDD